MLVRHLSLTIILLFTFSGAYLINLHLHRSYPPTISEEHLLYLPSGKFLKGAALAYDEIFADLMFIKTLSYFGAHARTDRSYTWLAHMLDVVTTLDPLYQFPYEFGGIILSTEVDNIEDSIRILKKGMANVPDTHPRYWYFPFYCAFQYMYFLKDFETAADYLEQAIVFEQSPKYLPLLAARLRANTQSPETAIPFIQEMIKISDSDFLKQQLGRRIKEIMIKKHLLLLNSALLRYHAMFSNYPVKLDDLVIYGMISKLPVHPMGGYYYYSHDTQEVKSSIKTDSLKVYIEEKTKSGRTDEESLERYIQKLINNSLTTHQVYKP